MKTKIENPDGSGYAEENLTSEQARNRAIQYSLMIDGPFTVYVARSGRIHRSLIQAFNIDAWQVIGYAENGKWYPVQ